MICLSQAHVQRVHVDGLARTKDDIVINTVRDVFTAQDFYSVCVCLQVVGPFQTVNVDIVDWMKKRLLLSLWKQRGKTR